MQMCEEASFVEKIKNLNHYELLEMKVTLIEALNSTDFQINLANKDLSSKAINKMLQSSVNTLDSALNIASSGASTAVKDTLLKVDMQLDLEKVT